MTDTTDLRFTEATARLRARDMSAAVRLLQAIIAGEPRHAPSLHLLGLIAGRDGRDADAVAFLERAILYGTDEQRLTSNLALATLHRRAGRVAQEEAHLRQALEAQSDSVHAHLQLGALMREQGRYGEAVPLLQRAVAMAADLAAAHGALAIAQHAVGDLAASAQSNERAVLLAPRDRNFMANMAVNRNAQGRFVEAATLCRTALADGEEAGLRNTLGIALKEQDLLDEAGESFEQAVALRPGFIEALYNLAGVRKDQGRTDEAVSLLRDVVARAPDLAAARFALCMAHLPPLYRDTADIARHRADYAVELDALIVHAARVGARALAPGIGAAQPFYLAYQGQNDVALQRRYGALVSRAMAETFPPGPLADPPRDGERLRLGIVSGYVRDHSVWRLPTRGWVEALDRDHFELFGYHTGTPCDAETTQAHGLFDRFVQGPLSLERWRETIAADRPHALIYPEIGMDPMAARLAAMRLARVQCASWGHPSTTGYPTIDFFLSSAAMEPAGADEQYAETLVRLPGLSTPVSVVPARHEGPSRRALGWPERAEIYWCGQSLYKYLPEHDGVFPAIAQRVPGCRFVFIAFPGSPALTECFCGRMARAFAAAGLAFDQYCIILPRMAAEDIVAVMGAADVVLDSIGWSGCNSLIDALRHPHPIVTVPGQTMRSRHGSAILHTLGMGRLICDDVQGYIETAVTLGRDVAYRAEVRAALAAGLGRLQDTEAVRALERHLIAACKA